MSSTTLLQVSTDHNNLQITVLHTCLHNGVCNKGKESLYQILEGLWTGKGNYYHKSPAVSLVHFGLNTFHIFSLCSLATLISPKCNRCPQNSTEKGKTCIETSSNTHSDLCSKDSPVWGTFFAFGCSWEIFLSSFFLYKTCKFFIATESFSRECHSLTSHYGNNSHCLFWTCHFSYVSSC